MSGGHFNPAATFAIMIAKRIRVSRGLQYIEAQLVGSVLAGLLLYIVLLAEICSAVHLGTPAFASGISLGTAVLVDAILTFAPVAAVFGTAIDPPASKIGGFGIGLVAGFWENHWVCWVGPILGGGIAGFVYEKFIME